MSTTEVPRDSGSQASNVIRISRLPAIVSRFIACLLAAGLVLTPLPPHARADGPTAEPAAVSSGPRLQWNPAWPYFRPIGYWLTGASVLGALGATFLLHYPDEARWKG